MTSGTDEPTGGQPLSDDDMTTSESGSAPQQSLDDADGTDGDSQDADGTDGGDADGTDADGTDGTDGSGL